MSDIIFGPASRGFISSNIAGIKNVRMNGKANSRGDITANMSSSSFRIQISI